MSFASSAQLKLVETAGFEIELEVVVCEGLEMIMAVVFVKTSSLGVVRLVWTLIVSFSGPLILGEGISQILLVEMGDLLTFSCF